MAVSACLLLSACGGGGGNDGQADASAMQPVDSPSVSSTAASAAASGPTTAQVEAVAPSTPDEMLTQAMQSSETPSDPASPTQPTTASLAATPGADNIDVVALAVGKGLASDAGPPSTSSVSTVYYIDSKLGNDSNNGLAAAVGGSGSGPWRSLAKLKLAALVAGDTVRLVCGSEWNETLALGASGTATQPITLAAYPSGCTTKPLINGSLSIAANQWSLHTGSIYKAALAVTPLQVFASTGGFLTQAHHPNQGHDSAQPVSMYARLAADSDQVLVNNRPTSGYITTGTDLKLPIGAAISAGTPLRIRSNAWTIEEHRVASVSGAKLTLAVRTAYPLLSGWGYYLLGQMWMLDSAGEWHFDNLTKTLYAWMPDARAPSGPVLASHRAIGIDLTGREYITVDGVHVRWVGTGAKLMSSTGVAVHNSRFEDTTEHGINAGNSQQTSVQASTFARIGMDAVTGQDDILPAAIGMQVANNTMTDIGVVMSGAVPVNLPRRFRAAIRPGANATVSGNSLVNAGYNGIWTLANSTISNNTLYGTCTLLDDCGAIYVSGANNNSVISGNLVQASRGMVAGKAPGSAYTQAQGIYLDELASGVTVSGNTVTDADNGIQLHVSSNNLIKDNKLYGNRNNQLWLQENRNAANPLGDLYGNTVTGNQIAPTSATARGIYLDTIMADTSRFGSFDRNRFLDTVYPLVAAERTATLSRQFTLPDWQAATTSGVARNLDPNGSGTSQTRFASVLMNGNNIVPNGQLATNTAGWTTWNATKPFGTLTREACTPGWCARYAAGATASILSSPNFSASAATWYRISFDAATGTDNQLLNVVVRRGGGGTNGYESLSDRSLNVTANRTWKRYSVVYKGTKTVNAADPVTKDLGARVDFQHIAPGQFVRVSNLEIVPIVPADALTRSDILLNASANPTQANCPSTGNQVALCAIYVRLSDNLPVAWPHYLAPRSAEIIYTRDARLVDSDGDGIPDGQDGCPGSTAGSGVNSRGCALGQT